MLIVIGPNNWLPTADWVISGRILIAYLSHTYQFALIIKVRQISWNPIYRMQLLTNYQSSLFMINKNSISFVWMHCMLWHGMVPLVLYVSSLFFALKNNEFRFNLIEYFWHFSLSGFRFSRLVGLLSRTINATVSLMRQDGRNDAGLLHAC